jgi:HK97 family phage major capsid protein
MTPEELKKLQELYELKRAMESAPAPQETPPAAVAVAERVQTTPEVRTPAADHQIPQHMGNAPQQLQQDPNAARFGQGVFMQMGAPTEADEEARWAAVEARYGRGMRLARFMRASAISQTINRDNTQEGVCRALQDVLRDRGMVAYAERAFQARNEASSQRPVDGGFLVPMAQSSDVLELLFPFLVLAKLGCTFVTEPSGSLSYPVQATSGSASYVGENKPIPKANTPTFNERSWIAKQLSSLFVMPRTLIQRASYDVDRIFKNDAGRVMAQKMEETAMTGNGQNGGIVGLNNMKGLTEVTLGALIDADNILEFEDALTDANVGGMASPGWLMSNKTRKALQKVNVTDEGYMFREEIRSGNLEGHPLHSTQNIKPGAGTGKPANVFFGDWAEYWIVRQGALEVASSDVAAYEDGAAVKAAFGRNQVVVRLNDFHDMNARRTVAIGRCKDAYTEAP